MIVDWVKVLYKNPKSPVRVNGCFVDFVILVKGVWQGCLSPLHFAIYIEPLD